ncbi:hypothetical protein AAY473_003835 [Plecturocebus cupreus]
MDGNNQYQPFQKHTKRPRQKDHLTLGVQDQPGQYDKTSSPPKIQKLGGCGGTHQWSQLLKRLWWEDRLSPHFGKPRWVDHLRSGIRDQPDQYGKTPSLLKIQKISQAWWHMPVISATWEAEVGESLEPGSMQSLTKDKCKAHTINGQFHSIQGEQKHPRKRLTAKNHPSPYDLDKTHQ